MVLAVFGGRPALAEEQVVYQSNFAEGVDNAWSVEETAVSPDGEWAYIGELHNGPAVLTLRDLPEHTFLRIRFDLLILKSWDGAFSGDGPDRVSVKLDDERTLMDASFTIHEGHQRNGVAYAQSFPGMHPFEGNPAHCGADVRNVDGLPDTVGQHPPIGNAVYQLEFCVPHEGNELRLSCEGHLIEVLPENLTIVNESWGIANMEIVTLDESPVQLDAERFAELWRDLGDDDAAKAHKALWELASAGTTVCELAADVAPFAVSDDELQKRVEQLIANLDDDDFQTREDASRDLADIAPEILAPIITAALQGDVSPEVRIRLEELLAQLRESGDSQSVLHSRIRHLLHVIGSEDAETLHAQVPEPQAVSPPNIQAIPREERRPIPLRL